MEASRSQTIDGSSFLMGVLTGGAIATGVALFLSPRLSDVRERLISFVTSFRDATSSHVQTVENRVADVLDHAADVADDLAARTQTVRNDVAKAVEHSAHALSQEARKVERFAKASQTDQHEKQA